MDNKTRRKGHNKRRWSKRASRKRMKLYINISCLVVVLLILFVLIFSIKSCFSKKSPGTEDIAKPETASAELTAQSGSLKDEIPDTEETDGSDALETVRISSDETENPFSGDSDPSGSDELSAQTNSDSASEFPASPITLTVSVVGDCTIGTDENFDYSQSPNAFFEYYGADYFFQNVKSIFAADDLTIANFEGTLTNSYNRQDKQFAFKAPPECASILTAGAIEAVNTANNHSHDYGEESFTDTMQALDAEGIVHFGYDETAVMDVKGVKIGLVGIYELNDHMGIAQQMKDNIARVRSQGANLVIVILHWGNEKEEMPDENQTTLGRMAIDEGADLVCGHHSHVLQGIENYKGKNIVYSLGNFCFGGNQYPSDMDSMIFQQTFTIGPEGVVSDNVTNIIPVSISSEAYFNNYQPTPAEGTEATRILNKIAERTSYIPLP